MQDRVGGYLAILSRDLNSNCLGIARVRRGVTFRAHIGRVCSKDEAELSTRYVHAGCFVLRKGDIG